MLMRKYSLVLEKTELTQEVQFLMSICFRGSKIRSATPFSFHDALMSEVQILFKNPK
jgi:hypothetical protein